MFRKKPASMALASNEKEECLHKRNFIGKLDFKMGKEKAKRLAFLKKISLTYNPVWLLLLWYKVVGLKHAELI